MICQICRSKDVAGDGHQDDCFRGAEEFGHKFDLAKDLAGKPNQVVCVACGYKQKFTAWSRGEPVDIEYCPAGDPKHEAA